MLIGQNGVDVAVGGTTVTSAGQVHVFERAAGGWASFDGNDDGVADGNYGPGDEAGIVTSPAPQTGGRFTAPLYNNVGVKVAWADTDFGGVATAAPKIFAPLDICSDRTSEGVTTTTCTLSLGEASASIPAGTPDRTFTISGVINARFGDGTQPANGLRNDLIVTVGEIDELAEIEFDFATDPATSRPYSPTVAPGGSTTLEPELLNENGKPSSNGAAVSVVFYGNRGRMSAALCAAEGEACQLASPKTALTADLSDKIKLTISPPGLRQTGNADLTVRVVDNEGKNLEGGPIAIIFASAASKLAISEVTRGLLNVGTCDTSAADGPTGCKQAGNRDDRDLLTV